MNFDKAKENIQPLACGRDAKRLEIALNAELNEDAQKELQRQKCEFETKIQNYCGDDPLENWFEYILWVEQCYPKSGKECAIDELLKKCLLQFGRDSKYFQDGRFIKLYMKFIDTQENPVEIYQQLYNYGIGTMVADFYIGWAYYYDLMDNYNKANEVFVKGIDARAQPLEDLEQAQKIFGLSIPARLLSRDEDDKLKFRSAMEEKRNALTSLRAHKHKHVGSLRTGSVIKSIKPGKLSSTTTQNSKSNDNRLVHIFQDSSKKLDDLPAQFANQTDTSITYSLIDKARDKENKKEPGPWSKTNKNQNQNVIDSGTVNLAFSIMEDENLGLELAIRLPPDFKRTNLPQTEYNVPLFYPEERAFSLPRYDKIMVYPGDGDEYSLEELRAWRYFKKMNLHNEFVARYDKIWDNEKMNLRIRIPPNFPKRNQKQTEFLTDPQPTILPNNQQLHVRGWTSYVYAEDLTFEDYLARKCLARLKNKTVIMNMSLDETTICEADHSVLMINETNVVVEETCEATTTPIPSPATKKPKLSTSPKLPFQIFTDEKCEGSSAPETRPPPFVPTNVETNNFAISNKEKEVVFKEPKYTGAIKKCIIKPPNKEPESKDSDFTGFSTEETFSTQNFVLFINQHETSTPVQNKKRSFIMPTKIENDNKAQCLSILPVKQQSQEIVSSPESEIIPKELSVIMETSESNTNSNTKSSVEDDTSKILLNCNQTTKSKTIGQNLSTIHENSYPRDPSGRKDSSKFTTLGLSGLKLTEDSVPLPKASTTRELCCEADELCELFSKTPDQAVKNTPIKPERFTSQKPPKGDNSLDDLLDFFKKSPKKLKKSFIPVPAPSAHIVINDSVTIPSFKDILLTNKCDSTATVTNLTTDHGVSSVMPKNQSIMPEFTENISIFTNKSKLASFTVPPKFNNDNSDLMRFSSKTSETSACEADLGQSIYQARPMIDDGDNFDDDFQPMNDPTFQHRNIDLNQTRQQIDACVTAENIDPWNVDLCNAFLEDLDFFSYLEKRDDCLLIYNVPSLKGQKSIEIADKLYNSIEYLAKGAFGYIYRGKDVASKKTVVLKQERPPNCWEYYIAIIITERIIIEFLPRFSVIQSALIGNNSSILVSDYIPFGTLIDVCNKMYSATSRHLDELVVMVLAVEIFTIVDLLHSADIIHGDIKPDNFLLTAPLTLDSNRPMLKLIDYGNSIDMQRFPPNTTFKTEIKTEDFICSEMMDGRSWTYQTDLYCVAGTLHVLLFGHYMKTENKLGKVAIRSKMPRYFNKVVWERIFTALLNVPDCRTFPNLQDFKLDLKEVLAERNKLVLDKIGHFNRIILEKQV